MPRAIFSAALSTLLAFAAVSAEHIAHDPSYAPFPWLTLIFAAVVALPAAKMIKDVLPR